MSKHQPLVTVIVPAFNRVQYIDEAVSSIERQDYPWIELIVVDDGSTDGTYEALLAMEEQGRLKLLTHSGRENRGQAAALNVGLRAARGDFVAILDSDDLFADGKVRGQIDYLVDPAKVKT